MDRQDYIEYLHSSEWKERRLEFMEDRGWECEECGDKASQVHHLNYESIGEEEDDDVEILCRECHEEKHGHDGYGSY